MMAIDRLNEHVIVVAQDRHQPALVGKFDQVIEHAPAVGPAVDVIAERDDQVIVRGANDGKQRATRPSSRECRRSQWFEPIVWSSCRVAQAC